MSDNSAGEAFCHQTTMLPVRVLIVDDSVVARKLLREALSASPGITVAGSAADGLIALAKIPQLNPDVITLDVDMPRLNGIQTLVEIRAQYPGLPVIMCSALTGRGEAMAHKALSLGASAYVAKPSNSMNPANAIVNIRDELSTKITSLIRRRAHSPVSPHDFISRTSRLTQRVEVLAMGASTGGPNALAFIIPKLPRDLPVPVLIVQHIPPLFTPLLVNRLNSCSALSVQEAVDGRILEPGQVWLAPGDRHLTVARAGNDIVLRLSQDPPVNSCRPAVDVLFHSVAQVYGPGALGVVMTGMGSDGVRGAARIREGGGGVIVQDESTSVVWGMAGGAVSAGVVDQVCTLPEIGPAIMRRVWARGV